MRKLDQRDQVLQFDPKGMYGLTEDYPNQCRKALEIAQEALVELHGLQPRNVVLSGLGGSAAGGDVVKAMFDAYADVPFSVNRDYAMPNFVGPDTLVIAATYSGMTEETLAAYADAKARGARIVGISSGGRIEELCKLDGFPFIKIPAGQPPRTALGYMLIPVLDVCIRLGFLPSQDFGTCFALLDRCAYDWAIESPTDSNPTKQLAIQLYRKAIVIYGLGGYQGAAAYRWKGQIDENSKNMAFAHAFPELCHNEVLGWVKAGDQGVDRWAVVILEDGTESAKMKKRAEVTAKLIEDVADVYRVQARGTTLLERCLSLIFFGDYVSLYLAAMNEVDPENIDSINILKAELAKVP